MSTRHVIECDRCSSYYYVLGLIRDAREDMAEVGWTREGGLDLCPRCVMLLERAKAKR